MTTEDDFQAALDANPEDWQTRLVFADWLQEHGDPRAEGYRALGTHRRSPCDGNYTRQGWVSPDFSRGWGESAEFVRSILHPDWWALICEGKFADRRTAEDAAALAFAKLPPERRAELLKGVLI